MTDKPGNKSNGWLEDESIVSRAYGKLGKPEPPVHLDEQILAEARRTAATRDPTVIRVQRWRKWTLPAALAATVVFAVPLVVRVFESAPPEFVAGRSSGVTVNGKTAMEPEPVESDRSLAELTSSEPAASVLNGRRADTIAAEMPGNALAMDRFEREVLPAEEQLQQAAETEAAAISSGVTSLDAPIPPAPVAIDPSGAIPVAPAAGFAPATRPAMTDDNFSAPPPGADAPSTSFGDDASELRYADRALASAAEPEAKRSEASKQAMTAAEMRRARSRSMATTDRQIARESGDDPATAMMATGGEQGTPLEEVLVRSNSIMAPEAWLDEIAAQYRNGHVLEARRELGSFLETYAGYELPDGYPLRAEDALFDEVTTDEAGEIVPEAAAWLRGIGLMAERGEIDQARTQLARFFKIYPDYPLPADFPLTREDALPIDR